MADYERLRTVPMAGAAADARMIRRPSGLGSMSMVFVSPKVGYEAGPAGDEEAIKGW